ncbi:molybdopterin-dependent oxidoreductase [Bacillaceae bacterium S4-13-56]
MTKQFHTSCPLNCWDNCGFVVTVENNEIVKIDGDADHPITKGKICGRGRSLQQKANTERRLKYPLKKINGQFQRISWEQALDEIAAIIQRNVNEYGSLSILNAHDYANNGLLKSIDERFYNFVGGVTELEGSLCWGSGIEAQKKDFGNVKSHSPEDITNSKNIVVWGRNVARTNLHLYQNIKEELKKGKKLIIIDPMPQSLQKSADLYVAIEPGMDGLLAIAISKEILEQGWENNNFLMERTKGYLEWKALIEHFSWNSIIEETNVSRETIYELAKIFVNGPTTMFLGLGMQRYKNGGSTIHAINALGAISGNIGVRGGGVNFGNLAVGQSFDINNLVGKHVKKEARYFKRMTWNREVIESNNPKIQTIFINRHNPITQVPDSNLTRKTLQETPHVIVLEQTLTETAELADYVLPVATVFEETDIYYSSMYHGYVNVGPKLIDPPEEVKSDLWVWTELSNRLGFGEAFNYTIEEWINLGLGQLQEKGITFSKLQKEKRMRLPIQDIPWENKKFDTKSGKFEFGTHLVSKGNFTKITDERKFPYHLLSIHPLRSNHSQHFPLLNEDKIPTADIPIYIAEKENIQSGDLIEVGNEKGKIHAQAKIMETEARNWINIDEGHWLKSGGAVNLLTNAEVSDNKMGSTYYDTKIYIKKAEMKK